MATNNSTTLEDLRNQIMEIFVKLTDENKQLLLKAGRELLSSRGDSKSKD